ncbi:MAG: hypothetical protein DME26_05655 [Verrucomicrobia bacterium]|nr:MAG: hypothetical protein DME26_05655 [Verrucomicrobiota bacterium]
MVLVLFMWLRYLLASGLYRAHSSRLTVRGWMVLSKKVEKIDRRRGDRRWRRITTENSLKESAVDGQ